MTKYYEIGALAEIDRLADLGANFAKAVAFIKSHDLAALPTGRNEIDGTNCWANVDEIELKPLSEKKPEVHHKYFDIQIPLAREETFGLARFDENAAGSFDEEKDIGFYDQAVTPLTLRPGEFALLYPRTCAHAPGCTTGAPCTQRKVIVKVRADD